MRLNPLILRNVGTSSFAFAVCVIRYDTQGIIYFRGEGRYLRDPTKRGGHRADGEQAVVRDIFRDGCVTFIC